MPAIGRRSRVLRIDQILEAFKERLLGDGEDTVLRAQGRVSASLQPIDISTDRDLRDEVGELDDLARMCVHECLDPRSRVVVLDLHDVGQGEGPVLLGDELDGRRVLVELAR